MIKIRNETEADYKIVEEITRKAFYIVIFGSPANYVSSGFKSCKKFNVSLEDGKYPAAMMVKELVSGVLSGKKWVYHDSPVMAVTEEDARRFDDTLEKMEKKHRASQEEFYIMSHSFVE